MLRTLVACPSGGKDLAIEVREGVGEGVATLVSAGRGRRVDMNVVLDEELLEHLASSDEEVAVAALASELEGTFREALAKRTVRGWGLDVRENDHLEIALDPVYKRDEIRRRADTSQVGVRWPGHVRLERYMVL